MAENDQERAQRLRRMALDPAVAVRTRVAAFDHAAMALLERSRNPNPPEWPIVGPLGVHPSGDPLRDRVDATLYVGHGWRLLAPPAMERDSRRPARPTAETVACLERLFQQLAVDLLPLSDDDIASAVAEVTTAPQVGAVRDLSLLLLARDVLLSSMQVWPNLADVRAKEATR